MGVDEELLSLHRYYLAANQQRVLFQDLIQRHAAQHGGGPEIGGENWNESWLHMSYWYSGLYVVIEGWRDLGLDDMYVDELLESPNVELLRRFRNGTFHYQREYWSSKVVDLIAEGEAPFQRIGHPVVSVIPSVRHAARERRPSALSCPCDEVPRLCAGTRRSVRGSPAPG